MKGAVVGVLLMAHGGGPAWNQQAEAVRAEIAKQGPAALALGMADAATLQAGVDQLTRAGARKIVAVPLFVSSYSEVLDQTRYLLGLRLEASAAFVEAMERFARLHSQAMGGHQMRAAISRQPVRVDVPLVMTPAFDDDPLIVAILSDRAKALSTRPDLDTVFVVGHGPVDGAANAKWLATLSRIAVRIRAADGFHDSGGATLRDDSSAEVKRAATEALRARILRAQATGGRAVVVPDLVATDGVESHVVEALKGLDFGWDGRTILPDSRVARWVAKAVEWGRTRDDMRLRK